MACRMQLYFCVLCLAITVKHLIISLIATPSDGISILACKIEAQQNEELYGSDFEVPRTITIMAEDLGTVIASIVVIEGDQPNVFMPNLTLQEN